MMDYCSSCLRPNSFIYPAVMIPAGRATMAIPNKEDTIVMTLPNVETGYISPYPTVVSETVAQYMASKKDSNESGSTLKMINAEINMYPAAKAQTDISESLEDRSTLQ